MGLTREKQPAGIRLGGRRDDALTIFIGSHNHRVSLGRLLRSSLDALGYLEEAGFAGEVLVIDNASRDGSHKLLHTIRAVYDEPRLRVLSLQEESGWAELRNLALSEAASRYVCVLEPNMELVPENLQLFLRSIVTTRAGMVYGNLLDREAGKVVDIRANMVAALRMSKGNHLSPMQLVDAPKVLRLGGYCRVHPQSPESWEMMLRLVSDEELIAFVPTVMGYLHRSIDARSWQPELSEDGVATLQRVHNWNAASSPQNARVGRLYHPHVGFLDE